MLCPLSLAASSSYTFAQLLSLQDSVLVCLTLAGFPDTAVYACRAPAHTWITVRLILCVELSLPLHWDLIKGRHCILFICVTQQGALCVRGLKE